MSIDTGNSEPVSQRPCPTAMKHYQWVKDEFEFIFEFITICIVQNVQMYLNALNSNKT